MTSLDESFSNGNGLCTAQRCVYQGWSGKPQGTEKTDGENRVRVAKGTEV